MDGAQILLWITEDFELQILIVKIFCNRYSITIHVMEHKPKIKYIV